ncbi:MAG: hypothetical protein LRY25_02755 [Flavobacterium sp.]|nr:hypothetical protein [Flavobacterium sp.]
MTLAGIVVIAANAGGAFSPIGDVTTTLLWIGGQVSAVGIVKILLLPSIMVLFIPLLLASYKMKGLRYSEPKFLWLMLSERKR